MYALVEGVLPNPSDLPGEWRCLLKDFRDSPTVLGSNVWTRQVLEELEKHGYVVTYPQEDNLAVVFARLTSVGQELFELVMVWYALVDGA